MADKCTIVPCARLRAITGSENEPREALQMVAAYVLDKPVWLVRLNTSSARGGVSRVRYCPVCGVDISRGFRRGDEEVEAE